MLTLPLLAAACAAPEKKLSIDERPALQIEVARGALLENDPTTALRFLLDAEKNAASNPDLHHLKALAYYSKGLLPEAEKSAHRAVELKPSYSDAWNTYGRVLIDRGRLVEAEASLKKAASDPLNVEAFRAKTNLGIVYYRLGRFDEATRAFDEAIRADEERSCVAYYYRGNLAIRANRRADALRDYRRASRPRMCGGFAEAQLALGSLHARMKNFQDARKTFLEVQKSYPDTRYAEQAMEKIRELP